MKTLPPTSKYFPALFIDRISIRLVITGNHGKSRGEKTLDTTWQIRVVQDDREAGSYEVISVHNAMQSISSLTIGLVNEQPLEFTINLGINHTSRLLLESCVRNGNYQWNDTALRTISTVARRQCTFLAADRKGRKLIRP